MRLEQRVVEVHRAFERRHIPHAFGGALALAYWTLDPRGTDDIDVNVFLPATDCERALDALPTGVERPPGTVERIRGEGQIRLWWEGVPVDLFFDYAPIHEEAARDRQFVPFLDTELPVLGPVELAVFKAMFDRTKDWADVEAMVSARRLDADAVRGALREMLGPGDHRLSRLDEAERLGALAAPQL